MVGDVILDRYRIVARLAAGAMGQVYRGERIGLRRAVAIKFLHPSAAADPAVRARFEGEARAASRMHHPNVVGVIDCGSHRGAPFVVLELVEGKTLRELLDAGPLSVARALRIVQAILAGLAHAHGHGVIHRDLKPENILVWSDELGEHVRITDFGLAKRLDAVGVSQDLAIGTPSYMSPEQTLGLPVDARADVYAVGVLLFELLAAKTPFRGITTFETLRLHREAPIPSVADLSPDISPELDGVVRRALAKVPASRYAGAAELATAIDDAMHAARERADELPVEDLLEAARAHRRWGYLAFAAACAAVLYEAL